MQLQNGECDAAVDTGNGDCNAKGDGDGHGIETKMEMKMEIEDGDQCQDASSRASPMMFIACIPGRAGSGPMHGCNGCTGGRLLPHP